MDFKDQKLIRVLSVLKKEELKTFRLFLESPILKIKQRPACIRLYDNLINKSKTKDDLQDFSVIDKNKIAIKTFGKEGDALKSLSVCMSFLYQAIIDYIGLHSKSIQNSLIADPTLLASFYFLEFLHKRKLDRLFNQYLKILQMKIDKSKKSESLYFIQLKTEQLRINQQYAQTNKRKAIDLSNIHLFTSKYHVLDSLKFSCQQENINSASTLQFESLPLLQPMFDTFLSKNKKGFNDILIQLYYLTYHSFSEGDKVKILFIKIVENADGIANSEIQLLLKYAKNICIRQIQKSRLEFISEVHKINKFLVQFNIFVIDNQVMVRDFTNTVFAASRSNDFDWGIQFIEEHTQFLPEGEREKNNKICKGLLLTEQGKYAEAIDLLAHVYFDKDPLMDTNRRNLVIKACFETDQTHYLSEQISSFIRYLNSTSKIGKKPKRQYKNFLQELRKLQGIREDFHLRKHKLQDRTDKLIESINSKELNNKAWLLQKVEQVKVELKL